MVRVLARSIPSSRSGTRHRRFFGDDIYSLAGAVGTFDTESDLLSAGRQGRSEHHISEIDESFAIDFDDSVTGDDPGSLGRRIQLDITHDGRRKIHSDEEDNHENEKCAYRIEDYAGRNYGDSHDDRFVGIRPRVIGDFGGAGVFLAQHLYESAERNEADSIFGVRGLAVSLAQHEDRACFGRFGIIFLIFPGRAGQNPYAQALFGFLQSQERWRKADREGLDLDSGEFGHDEVAEFVDHDDGAEADGDEEDVPGGNGVLEDENRGQDEYYSRQKRSEDRLALDIFRLGSFGHRFLANIVCSQLSGPDLHGRDARAASCRAHWSTSRSSCKERLGRTLCLSRQSSISSTILPNFIRPARNSSTAASFAAL